jgi:hypothetical protein
LRIWKMTGIDKIEMPQTHRLHRPRRRADIARMGGVTEYNSDVT